MTSKNKRVVRSHLASKLGQHDGNAKRIVPVLDVVNEVLRRGTVEMERMIVDLKTIRQ